MNQRLKPRDYQVEAFQWALKKRNAVVCMPTGTGKTLIAGLWIKELLNKGKARKVLVLEPTRFLVEQNAGFLRNKMSIDARPLHGSLPRSEREKAWNSKVIVATPEIIIAEWKVFERQGFDALVVDECHHTTGQDPFNKVVNKWYFKYKLGLTALIPSSRRREIEETIGEIKCWSWSHPSIAKYMPVWATEFYEASFNSWEMKLYEALESLWASTRGRKRVLLGNAIRWLARDGAAALRESYLRSERIRELLEPIKDKLFDQKVREAHKLDSLLRVLSDHEGFEKTIVFVDRIIIANIIYSKLRNYGVALLLGSRYIKPHTALEIAKKPETRLIISTSAGEEGIDLPEADLLVLWSNTASPLRFVQRLGRVLRTVKNNFRQKYVVFIVTPDTVDVDSLIDGIVLAERSGVYVSVSKQTLQHLINISRRRRILDIIYERPMTVDLIARAVNAPEDRIKAGLSWLVKNGYIIYIYTWMGRVYLLSDNPHIAYTYYRECLTPSFNVLASITVMCNSVKSRTFRFASYHRAISLLSSMLNKCHNISSIRARVFYMVRGTMWSKQLSYNYIISNQRVLKLVVDNIYAQPNCLDG